MDWIVKLFTEESIAQTIVVYGLTIAIGLLLGRVKIAGISLGVTWILFAGLFISYMGIHVNMEMKDLFREFGLILFVYTIGLQVGPGFFASLKKGAFTNNGLAIAIVGLGILITIILYYSSHNHISVMAGVMSGAVTNTPGLAAAQAAASDLNVAGVDKSMITLAYASTYPLGVFGIIASLVILQKIFKVNIQNEQEFHRKLNVIRSNRPISVHLSLENKQLFDKPLRRLFELLKEPIVVSRMFHNGEIITPTPEVVLAQGDVLLVVGSKEEVEQLKLLIGPESDMNLKQAEDSTLISRHIMVTRSEVTHKRLGDLPELHQQEFTLTRIRRAGIEMLPHGDILLQLGDQVKVVGTEEGVHILEKALGNSMKKLETPDLAPIFIGIVLGVILGSVPFFIPNIPIPVKIGLAGGPLIVALLLSRFGNVLYLNNYTTNSANHLVREIGIALFLASVGLGSGKNLSVAFGDGTGWVWMGMGLIITMVPLLIVGIVARLYFKKTYFEICGLLAGASTDPPALAFATKIAGSDIPSVTYATVYPMTMILRIVGAQLLILLFS